MRNHLKAERYKFRHSRIPMIMIAVSIAIIAWSFANGDIYFFAAGTGTKIYVGFHAKGYLSETAPSFMTVAFSALAYTAYFWIVGILFAATFFIKEYKNGTIKLAVAYGTKSTVLYSAKTITILGISLLSYLMFVLVSLLIDIVQSGYIPTGFEAINFFGFAIACGIVLLALENVTIFLCTLIPNIGIVIGICCLYVFMGEEVYLSAWNNIETLSLPVKLFLYANPMYYWMNFCIGSTYGFIEHLGAYFLGSVLLLICGGYIMSRKEIK